MSRRAAVHRARVMSHRNAKDRLMEQPWIRIELYAFSYFDTLRGRWVRARYRATLEVIAARYEQYRVEGSPEVREGTRDPRILGGGH